MTAGLQGCCLLGMWHVHRLIGIAAYTLPWNLLGYALVYWATPWNLLGYALIYRATPWNLLGYALEFIGLRLGIYWATPWNLLGYAATPWNLLGYVGYAQGPPIKRIAFGADQY